MSHRHLTRDELECLGKELDSLRQQTLASLNADDAKYIRQVRASVRWSAFAGRALLMGGWIPPFWLAGTALLSLSKILDNMELGHNVMHGQFDWMRDPEFASQKFEWDNVCPAPQWRHSHNYMHHTFTNIVGMDRDVGYGILRLFPDQPWHAGFLLQPLYAALLAVGFEWGVALHDLEFDRVRRGEKSWSQVKEEAKPILKKIRRQVAKDYLIFPLLAGPAFVPVLAGNFVANVVRNLWAFTIIFCGHFTEDAQTFPLASLDNESRGAWYRRQILGSSNILGEKWFHILSGNLSHQIEHHLFPDVPANRYAEMAVEVRRLCEKYDLPYNTGSLGKQFGAAIKRIFRFSLPGGTAAEAITVES